MEIYITKWALSKGILKAKVTEFRPNDSVRVEGYHIQFYTPDWHKTEKEAVLDAEWRRKHKLLTLEKLTIKYKRMKFKIKER